MLSACAVLVPGQAQDIRCLAIPATAGNNRLNLDLYKSLGYANNPCFATGSGNLLCIGATDGAGRLAPFSNYGASAVQLTAPGVDIKSTYLGE